MFTVTLSFPGDLAYFLRRELRTGDPVQRLLGEKTAVKDVIEACGVPHSEVDLIILRDSAEGGAQPIDFSWQLQEPSKLEIHAAPAPDDLFPDAPRLQVRPWTRFVADGHLGKLTRCLRLLGLDIVYERDADDR